MGQITRLLRNVNNEEDVYPVDNTTSVTPGDGSVLGQLLAVVCRQNDNLSIREASITNSGRTVRFTYTNNEIEDVDLPESIKAITFQKNGDTDILTITGITGNIQVFNIFVGREYEVLPNSSNVHVNREDYDEGITKLTVFKVSVDNPEIPEVNNGRLTIRYGNNSWHFDANQAEDTVVDIPTVNIPSTSVVDKDVTLNYNERETIATINGTDIHVTLPEKPESDISLEFYDITVKNELELFRAIAVSRGYPISEMQNITSLQNANQDWIDTVGYSNKRVQVRIHFAGDITLDNITRCNLSTVTINGNNYRLVLKKQLNINGRTTNFKDLVFVTNSNYASSNNSSGSRWVLEFTGDSLVHNRYNFERCQFNGCVTQSSGRSNDFVHIKVPSENSDSTTCSISFYFCIWITNSNDNSTLAEGGKIKIYFDESGMGSSNVLVAYNKGVGTVGSHSCKTFQTYLNISNSGELVYDNASDLETYYTKQGNGTLSIHKVF